MVRGASSAGCLAVVLLAGCLQPLGAEDAPADKVPGAWLAQGGSLPLAGVAAALASDGALYVVGQDRTGWALWSVALDEVPGSTARLGTLPSHQYWQMAWHEGALWMRGSSSREVWYAVPMPGGMHGDAVRTDVVHEYHRWTQASGLVALQKVEGDAAVAGSALVTAGGSLLAVAGWRSSGSGVDFGRATADVRRVDAGGEEAFVGQAGPGGHAAGGPEGWVVVGDRVLRLDSDGNGHESVRLPCDVLAGAQVVVAGGHPIVAGRAGEPCVGGWRLVRAEAEAWQRLRNPVPQSVEVPAFAAWGESLLAVVPGPVNATILKLSKPEWGSNAAPRLAPRVVADGPWVRIEARASDADGDPVDLAWQGPGLATAPNEEQPTFGGGGGVTEDGLRVPHVDGATYTVLARDPFGSSATATVPVEGRPTASVLTFACGPTCAERHLSPQPQPESLAWPPWRSAGIVWTPREVKVGWTPGDASPEQPTMRFAEVRPSGAQGQWEEAAFEADPSGNPGVFAAIPYEAPPAGECRVWRLQPHAGETILQSSELQVCRVAGIAESHPLVSDDWE